MPAGLIRNLSGDEQRALLLPLEAGPEAFPDSALSGIKEPLINRKAQCIADYKVNMRAKSMHQLSFEDTTYLNRPRKTWMQKLLERRDAVLPWKKFVSEIAPFYPKAERGRPPIPLETMLRVYFL